MSNPLWNLHAVAVPDCDCSDFEEVTHWGAAEIESLRQQLAAITSQYQVVVDAQNATLDDLAASQAYAAQLREALDEIANKEFLGNLAPAQDIAAKALAIQADDSALRAAIADELEGWCNGANSENEPWVASLRHRANELRNKP